MSVKMIMLIAMMTAPFAAAAGKTLPSNNVGSIITLLTTLKEQAIEEGKVEEEAYAKFTHWCQVSQSKLRKAIGEEDTTIDQLNSAVAGYKQTDIRLAGDQSKIASYAADTTISGSHRKDWIEEVDGDISDLESEAQNFRDAAAAAAIKNTARISAYNTKNTNLGNTLIAVQQALANMTLAGTNVSSFLEAKKFLSRDLALLSMETTDEQRQVLIDFVANSVVTPAPVTPAPTAPAAVVTLAPVVVTPAPTAAPTTPAPVQAAGDAAKHVTTYTFKSGPVVELLKGLVMKFQDDIVAANREEIAAANAYALEYPARAAALAATEKSEEQKKATDADTVGALAEANGGLENEKSDLEVDTETLQATVTSCKTGAREWAERSKTRTNEITAISMATKILAKVSGVRTEKPNNPVLGASPIVFLQVADPKTKVVNLLRATAKTTHSKALERLASEISSRKGPFATVNDAIQKMVFKLMKEQVDEDKHKAWCDIELDKTSKSKDLKTDKIAALTAKINLNTASLGKLTQAITAADEMVSDINTYMTESTEIRTAGRMENKLALKDAQAAQTAIANAVAVLEEHYKASGMIAKDAWEFLQTASTAKDPIVLPANPALWDSAYTGVSDPATAGAGVIAILLEVASDFSQMEAQTKAQEAEDQRDFDREMTAHKVEKNRRAQESAAKLSEKKRKVAKGASMELQNKKLEEELEAVTKYQEDLQAPCVTGDSSYATKKFDRAAEMTALKTSQTTLKEAFKLPKVPGYNFLEVKPHA